MGRPRNSIVRHRVLAILFFLGASYGYEVYKKYIKIFGTITMRDIYYHIKRLLKDRLIKIKELKKIQGDFTWGSISERIYYENNTKNFSLPRQEIEKINSLKKHSP